MWLKNVKPNNALPLPDVSPWIPLVLSFDPIFTLANTFSHDMKANSKETDPKVIAFSFNPSSPKREETQLPDASEHIHHHKAWLEAISFCP